MLIWACDIIPSFILRQDLTLSENIVLNYLILTKDKAKAIGMSMNFIARSAAQRALANLSTKYKMVSIDNHGQVTILRQFATNTILIPINNRTGRPSKLSQALLSDVPRDTSGDSLNLTETCSSTSTPSAT